MIKVKKIIPMFNGIITTMDKYEDDVVDNGLITRHKGAIKEFQKVVAIGNQVREVNVGDLIKIDPDAYKVVKHKEGSMKDGVIEDNVVVGYNFKTVKINGTTHLYIYDRDVEYIVSDYEEIDTSGLIKPDKLSI